MIPSYHLLNTRIDALTLSDLKRIIIEIIESSGRSVIANHNLHSLYLLNHDDKMRAFYKQAAQIIHIDGTPLVLLARLMGYPVHREHRVTSLDWMGPVLGEAANRNWRIFYLGSKPGIAERGVEILHRKFSRLQITTAHGYFDASPGSQENQTVLAKINAYQPHILLVGMGMPRQEHWIFDNLDSLQTNVILPIGAYIDYVAGEIPTPPRWLGKYGLEWIFRLATEPRRLWRRYLIEPWFVLGLFLKDVLRGPTKEKS